ncbi:MAG: hypothetical protein ABSA13_06690 [Beijerinckiaceae bacterium]|jgi:hypothetical protein
MLNEWFYSHPTWEVTLAVCSVIVLATLAGLLVFNRLVHWEAREKDTTMTGLSYALAGGLFAIVISFVAVGVYEAMDKGEAIASAEANSLSGIVFDSAGLPADLASRVRDDVDKYIVTVTKKEWPSQQAYHMEESNFEEGWALLRRINFDLSNYDPATMGQATVKRTIIHSINDLFSARRARLLAAGSHLPDSVWQMMIFGLVLVSIYIYLFGPHSFKIHMAVTGLTMVSFGLVFSLIIALDYPFRGDLSVDDEAFLSVKQIAASIFEPKADKPEAGDKGAEGPHAVTPEAKDKNEK